MILQIYLTLFIKNHYDNSNYFSFLLGYDVKINEAEDREIYILNSDFEGFSGYGKIKIKDNKESKINILYK